MTHRYSMNSKDNGKNQRPKQGNEIMQHDVRFHIRYGTTTNSLEAIPLTASLVIGRALTADVVVQDPMSSRQHARFFIQEGFGWVEDLNSSNGSFLNGRRLLEATRIADGDVLSIGQLSFYGVADSTSEPSSLQWSQTIGSILADIKNGVQGQVVSGVQTALLLQTPSHTFEELCDRFIELIQSRFPVQSVDLWMSDSQRFGDLTKVSQVDSKTERGILDAIDSSVQQLVWTKHHIVCEHVGEKSGVWVKAHTGKFAHWRTIIPIVWDSRSIGVLVVSSDVEARTFIHDLVLAIHWYTKERSNLEPWDTERLSQTPLVSSMQWILANETARLDLDTFQHRHGILRAVLRLLTQELDWSTHETYVAESVMVLVDSGAESLESTEKIRWYELSSTPFMLGLVGLANGVLGRGPANTSTRMIKLCMDLVDLCLTESFDSSEEGFNQLSQRHDLREYSFSVSDFSAVFQLVQQLDQQVQETQLFGR